MRGTRWACAASVVIATACHGASPSSEAPTASGVGVAPVAASPAPVDHLAPGELIEGTDRAFDVLLPRGLRIDESFVDVVYATGEMPLHPLADYFRAHLQNGDLREGSTTATFDRVTAPGKPDRPLSVHILKVGQSCRVDIHDLTLPALPPLPDQSARWKHVGLTPGGRIVDPTHLD